jgi:membrane-associated phospholipid phosphatase
LTFSARREAGLGLGTYAIYLLVRRLSVTERGRRVALRNGRRIVAFERRLGLQVEPRLQAALVRHRRAMAIANFSYVTLNVAITVGWLALLYRRRDPRYHRLRTAWMITTLGAQPFHLLAPTAPPRKLDGFIDTILEGGLDLESSGVVRLYNPLAAMPSIHVGYAVVTAAGVTQAARSRRLRWLARGYPPAVAVIVLATANHYVSDVVAGAILGIASLRLAPRLTA